MLFQPQRAWGDLFALSQQATAADALVKAAIDIEAGKCDARVATSVRAWADCIKPIPWSELPSNVTTEIDSFEEPSLATLDFPNPCPVAHTKPLSKPVPQPVPEGFSPKSINDLLTPEAIASILKWVKDRLVYLRNIELHGPAATHKSNVPLALGQSAFKLEARGIIWDLRRLNEGIIEPVDFTKAISSHLNLDLLATELAQYPDQELLSFLLQGVQYKANVDLQIVLLPHLISLSSG